jgi:hypothetical protein
VNKGREEGDFRRENKGMEVVDFRRETISRTLQRWIEEHFKMGLVISGVLEFADLFALQCPTKQNP